MKLLFVALLFIQAHGQWTIEPNFNPDAKELIYKLISPDTLQLDCDCKMGNILFYNVFEPKKYIAQGSHIKIPLHALRQKRYTIIVSAGKKLIVFRLVDY